MRDSGRQSAPGPITHRLPFLRLSEGPRGGERDGRSTRQRGRAGPVFTRRGPRDGVWNALARRMPGLRSLISAARKQGTACGASMSGVCKDADLWQMGGARVELAQVPFQGREFVATAFDGHDAMPSKKTGPGTLRSQARLRISDRERTRSGRERDTPTPLLDHRQHTGDEREGD